MFENIGSFLKKIMKNEQKELLVESTPSKDAAKERLHIVLMQDRANVSADFLELMKEEIVDVIKKYIVVDESQIDVRLTNQENEDGTIGAPSLHANIPILNIRNDIKGEVLKENEKAPIIEKVDNDKTQIIQIVTDEDLKVNTNIETKEKNEENSLIKNENLEEVLVEEKSELSENNEEENINENNEVDNKELIDNIQENQTSEHTINEESLENSQNSEKILVEENESNGKKSEENIELNIDLSKENENIKDELEKEIEDLLDEEDDDDDVTFDDLLKAAEEEERLKKLENQELENKEQSQNVELENNSSKKVNKKTEKPKRKIKSKTSQAKKNKK